MRRQQLLFGLLIAVILFGLLALIKSQPWGRLYLRLGFLKPDTRDWIACVELKDGLGDIQVIQPNGTILKLTDDPYDDRSPDWSPDGGTLVFSSNRRENVYQLFLIDPDGRNLRPITVGGGAKLEPVFHHDGKHLLHVAQGLITEMDTKGTHAEQILPPPPYLWSWRETFGSITFRYARWSREERLIATVRITDEGEEAMWYYVEPGYEDQQPPQKITTGERVELDWAPQELKLAVTAVNAKIQDPSTGRPYKTHFLLLLDFSEVEFASRNRAPKIQPLWVASEPREAAVQPVWSLDGSRIAFVRCRVQEDGSLLPLALMTIPSDGGPETEIVAGEIYDPHWAPDGERLVFTMGRPGARQIYTVRLDGTELKRWTERGDHIRPRWCPKR